MALYSFCSFQRFAKRNLKIFTESKSSKIKSFLVSFNLLLLKFTRPFLPPFFSFNCSCSMGKAENYEISKFKISGQSKLLINIINNMNDEENGLKFPEILQT